MMDARRSTASALQSLGRDLTTVMMYTHSKLSLISHKVDQVPMQICSMDWNSEALRLPMLQSAILGRGLGWHLIQCH